MSVREKDVIRSVFYPDSDGQPMGETDWHIQLIIDLREALAIHFSQRGDVCVGSNMLLYYRESDPKSFVVPDVFFASGVGNRRRRVYKVWEEGKAPDVVFEISSRSTKKEDFGHKLKVYEQLGVQEYFIFDPEYSLKPQPLRAWRLESDILVPVVVTNNRVDSAELILELVDTGTTLRLFDSRKGRLLPTPRETAEEHLRLEEELKQAAQAKSAAEAELAKLKAEIAKLRKQIKDSKKG